MFLPDLQFLKNKQKVLHQFEPFFKYLMTLYYLIRFVDSLNVYEPNAINYSCWILFLLKHFMRGSGMK